MPTPADRHATSTAWISFAVSRAKPIASPLGQAGHRLSRNARSSEFYGIMPCAAELVDKAGFAGVVVTLRALYRRAVVLWAMRDHAKWGPL